MLISANDTNKNYRKGENLGLKALEAYLSANKHMVFLFDLNRYNLSDKELMDQIYSIDSNLIGFSVSFTNQIYETIRLATLLKEQFPQNHFVLGGQGVSFILEQVLFENLIFDSGVAFEGEIPLLQLVNSLEQKKSLYNIPGLYFRNINHVEFNGYSNPIENLDFFPFIIRDISSKVFGDNHFTIISSRGCNGKCSFCASGFFSNTLHKSKKWRYRTAENMLQEIENVYQEFGELAVSFVDDNFLGRTTEGYVRAEKFAKLVLEKDLKIKWSIECRADDVEYNLFKLLKRAGLCNVFIGVESGNTLDLKLFNKQITLIEIEEAFLILKSLDISFDIGFIMFHPNSCIQQLIENISFLKKHHSATSKTLLTKLTLYHGSPLINYFQKMGLVHFSKYSIWYDFRSKNVKKIFDDCTELFVRFQSIEIEMDKIIFQLQTSKTTFKQDNERVNYAKLKCMLSDFEADIFLCICQQNDEYYKEELKSKISEFDMNFRSWIEKYSLGRDKNA